MVGYGTFNNNNGYISYITGKVDVIRFNNANNSARRKIKKCSKDIHSIDNDKSSYNNKYDYMMVCK